MKSLVYSKEQSVIMSDWTEISAQFQGFQEQLGLTKVGINVVNQVISEVTQAERTYHSRLDSIKENAMKLYDKSNLSQHQTTQTVTTQVIKNLIETLVSNANAHKKYNDILDVEVRKELRTTVNTLGESIDKLNDKIHDVNKGLKEVRKSHAKSKSEFLNAKANVDRDPNEGKPVKRLFSKKNEDEIKEKQKKDLFSKHEEYVKQTQVFNSMQKHLLESTLPNIVSDQEKAYKASIQGLHKATVNLQKSMHRHYETVQSNSNKITKNLGESTEDVDTAVASIYEHMTMHPVKEHKDLGRHLSSVDSMANVLNDLNMLPPNQSPNQRMPRINSNSSFDDDDTYWDNNYDDDVIADEPSNIKNKPLPAIPVAERNNQYINSTDDYFKFKIKFDFDASSYGEGYLSLKSGDELYSESDDAISGWITVQYKGESGLVPFNYLEPY